MSSPEFPEDFFDPPAVRPDTWPDNPDLRRAVGWFKSFMSEVEWKQRRLAAAQRLYDAALGRGGDTWSVARRLRHRPQPERMAAGPANLGDDALVRRTPSRVPCPERL
jgi:hypothetical protein